ncbi:MAG: glycine oxidase ThiO [Ketobacteraceae bacterium]|nr:glycine oxidase ThiO [Ketobacteraceae bacterium]
MTDVIIVGGGIIGLLTARELTAAGCSVKLIDKQEPGREASWAGGGIVSPLYPWHYDDAITGLVRWAQAYYPELSEALLAETGIDPEFSPCGLYMLDSEDHDKALQWARRVSADLAEVDIEQVYCNIPALRPGYHKALMMPGVGNIRNPRLLKALVTSLLMSEQFELVTHEPVNGLWVENNRLLGVQSDSGHHKAGKVLIAAGAWSPLLTQSLDLSLTIEPVRGEMLVFEPKPGLLPSMVLSNGKYLIPRRDGRIVVGSTTERVGYNKDTTGAGRETLLTSAFGIMPMLKTLRVEKHWAGLRPGAPAGLPFMGEAPDTRGLFVCAGHYRNGLVTAPASARLMADLMLGRAPEISPEPFRLDRETIEADMY